MIAAQWRIADNWNGGFAATSLFAICPECGRVFPDAHGDYVRCGITDLAFEAHDRGIVVNVDSCGAQVETRYVQLRSRFRDRLEGYLYMDPIGLYLSGVVEHGMRALCA